MLRVDRGLTWNEIASVLAEEGESISKAALWKRFERLKEKLRKLVRGSGVLEE